MIDNIYKSIYKSIDEVNSQMSNERSSQIKSNQVKTSQAKSSLNSSQVQSRQVKPQVKSIGEHGQADKSAVRA